MVLQDLSHFTFNMWGMFLSAYAKFWPERHFKSHSVYMRLRGRSYFNQLTAVITQTMLGEMHYCNYITFPSMYTGVSEKDK